MFLGLTPWLGILAGNGLAALLGFGLGFLCIRMGGYLSLTTLGFSEILRIVITNEEKWTRGTMGLQTPGLFASIPKRITTLSFSWRPRGCWSSSTGSSGPSGDSPSGRC